MRRLQVSDFAGLLGVPPRMLPVECRRLIRDLDFAYRPLRGSERDRVILKVFATLESELPVSGPSRLSAWEKGWSENLRAFVASRYDVDALTPRYYRKGNDVMRLRGDYVNPRSRNFELNFLEVLRTWIAKSFLGDFEHVYEFGCGPGHNLAALWRLFPSKHYHGLDWAVASGKIVHLLSTKHGIDVDWHRFDLFHPDGRYELEPSSAVVTVSAMEQLGIEFEAFLKYLLHQSPGICIHVEPIYELYDRSTLFDYLAAKYSEKRGYLRGYLARLKELEKERAIELLHVSKSVGSLYHDGWTTVAWRPSR